MPVQDRQGAVPPTPSTLATTVVRVRLRGRHPIIPVGSARTGRYGSDSDSRPRSGHASRFRCARTAKMAQGGQQRVAGTPDAGHRTGIAGHLFSVQGDADAVINYAGRPNQPATTGPPSSASGRRSTGYRQSHHVFSRGSRRSRPWSEPPHNQPGSTPIGRSGATMAPVCTPANAVMPIRQGHRLNGKAVYAIHPRSGTTSTVARTDLKAQVPLGT